MKQIFTVFFFPAELYLSGCRLKEINNTILVFQLIKVIEHAVIFG